jgi:hypothetical protein
MRLAVHYFAADMLDFADRDGPVQAVFAAELGYSSAMRIVQWRENYLLTTLPALAVSQKRSVVHNEGRPVLSVL